MSQKPRLVTGIRPTGELHLGNYLGAIKPAVAHQARYEQFLFIADLHAVSEPYAPSEMPQQVKNIALDYLAGGIDPGKSALFIQSHVQEHTELMWLLNTLTPVGELQRMIQYKELSARYDTVMAGILNYPILMAADILIYKADFVPVGHDQTQHLELASDLAKKFNKVYGETFPIPQNTSEKNSALRLRALHDPDKKMSKSLGPKSYIAITDDADIIRKKIASAVTDTGKEKQKSHPKADSPLAEKAKNQNSSMSLGVKNLFDLLQLTDQGDIFTHLLTKYNSGELKYSELKPVVADSIIEYLKPIQTKRKELEKNLDYVASVLAQGAEQARKIASSTLREVKEKMGLL